MRRTAATLATFGLFLIATGTVSQADTPAPRQVIEIACDHDGVRVLRDEGDAGPKGVTVRLRTPEGQWSVFYDGAPNNWSWRGDEMVAELQLPIPPGTARVQCMPSADGTLDQHDPRWWVEVTVHDPKGLWRSPRLDCPHSAMSHWHGGRVPAEREAQIVREALTHVTRAVDGDLRLLGYPRQTPRDWGLYRDGGLKGLVRMMPPSRDGTVAPNFATGC